MIARHSTVIQAERERLDATMIRHRQAISDPVAGYRSEVLQLLDQFHDRKKALFVRNAIPIHNLWVAIGMTQPFTDTLYWSHYIGHIILVFLAREKIDELEGIKIVSFFFSRLNLASDQH
ncbi:hypothetical protein Plhal304r1_c048g0129921 [Plasmopara halstedii]